MSSNPKYVPTDRPGLVLDTESGAILNVDNRKLAQYRQRKAAMEAGDRSSARIDRLERDVSDIKGMLSELVETLKKAKE